MMSNFILIIGVIISLFYVIPLTTFLIIDIVDKRFSIKKGEI